MIVFGTIQKIAEKYLTPTNALLLFKALFHLMTAYYAKRRLSYVIIAKHHHLAALNYLQTAM